MTRLVFRFIKQATQHVIPRAIQIHTTAWQAILMPLKSRKAGRIARLMSVACGQREWKVQPVGGLKGLGTSPCPDGQRSSNGPVV